MTPALVFFTSWFALEGKNASPYVAPVGGESPVSVWNGTAWVALPGPPA